MKKIHSLIISGAIVLIPHIVAYGNQMAPDDPWQEICPGVSAYASQAKKLSTEVETKEVCRLYKQFSPSSKEIDIGLVRKNHFEIHILTKNGVKIGIKEIGRYR